MYLQGPLDNESVTQDHSIMREVTEPVNSCIPPEDGCDSDLHWSGTFFDQGTLAKDITLHYVKILRFDFTYPKSGSDTTKTRLSSGLVLQALSMLLNLVLTPRVEGLKCVQSTKGLDFVELAFSGRADEDGAEMSRVIVL